MRLATPWAALAALTLCGCNLQQPRFTETREFATEHAGAAGLRVATENGSIEVTRHEGADVLVTAEVQSASKERLAEARVVLGHGADGMIELGVEWPGGKTQNGDGCSFTVAMPESAVIDARSSNGRITVSGFTAEVAAKTSNGRVTVLGASSAVTARTSNGRITVEGAQGPVDADTSNGSITVVLAGPGPVTLDTSNGSITLTLSPEFRGTLDCKTSNGSVKVGPIVSGVAPAAVNQTSKTRAVVTVGGDDAPPCSAHTSNGSVTVTMQGE